MGALKKPGWGLRATLRALAAVLLSLALLTGQDEGSGEEEPRGPLPEELLRPQRGEAPRFPRDIVIGELGMGEAPLDGYYVARRFLTALLKDDASAEGSQALAASFGLEDARVQEYRKALEPISPQKYRLGDGREEVDGGVSFLFRFIGREQWITGELYLRFEVRKPKPAADLPAEEPAETEAAADVPAREPADEAADVPAEEPVAKEPAADVPAREPAAQEKTEAEPEWSIEDVILEDPRDITDKPSDPYRYDLAPYERFY